MKRHVPTAARSCAATVILLLLISVFAQDGAYIQGRLDGMQRQLNRLSATPLALAAAVQGRPTEKSAAMCLSGLGDSSAGRSQEAIEAGSTHACPVGPDQNVASTNPRNVGDK